MKNKTTILAFMLMLLALPGAAQQEFTFEMLLDGGMATMGYTVKINIQKRTIEYYWTMMEDLEDKESFTFTYTSCFIDPVGIFFLEKGNRGIITDMISYEDAEGMDAGKWGSYLVLFAKKSILKDEVVHEFVPENPQAYQLEYSRLRQALASGGASSSPRPNTGACPDGNHPHAIDLGLPSGTKWACCNVGASKPEEYGGYYAWGETETKSTYNKNTYRYYNASTDTYSYLGSNIAGTSYDVAHVKWGGNWKMPTKAQMEELNDKCHSEWTELNGMKGCKFTGPNGRYVYLPFASEYIGLTLLDAGSAGMYWSSTPSESEPNHAYYLYINKGPGYVGDYAALCVCGLTIRPVQ